MARLFFRIGLLPFLTGLLILLTSCGGPLPHWVNIQVQDQQTEQGLDSAKVKLYQQFGEQAAMLVDSQWTSLEGNCTFEIATQPGYQYYVVAERVYFQEALAEGGGTLLNQADLQEVDSQQVELILAPIPPPDPERFEKMHEVVPIHEVIGILRSDQWEWAFLPKMAWEDIPSLLEIGTDSTYIHVYPHHPLTTYQPDSVRVGLVALWLIEAIRRSEIRSEAFIHLMHPSRAPVLGTRRGNPSGFNSLSQIQQAQQGYQQWWEQTQAAENRAKAARANPLRGLGMSWM
ncbi:MAG: DUF4943 family protein [Bacteroidota bacterium]